VVASGGGGSEGGGVAAVGTPLASVPVRRCLRLLTQALSPRLPELPLPLLFEAVAALSAAGVTYLPLLRSVAGWAVALCDGSGKA